MRVELDAQLVEEVRRALGTTTAADAVEAALRRGLRAHARREEVEALRQMEGMDLDDAQVMKRAWGE